ncbi:MAG: hypothetical protein EAS48_02810 [Chryseobacterium sp.]|nr:MAG: hypothetical protein EAS48_02810 [Chryseobacterium sp.]
MDHFNHNIAHWISKGYTIVNKDDAARTAVMVKKAKINHPLHIVLTLITAGVWIFVYLIILFGAGKTDTIVVRDTETPKPWAPDELTGAEYLKKNAVVLIIVALILMGIFVKNKCMQNDPPQTAKINH